MALRQYKQSMNLERFALETSKDNKYYFNFKALNHQIISAKQIYIRLIIYSYKVAIN